MNEWQPMESAPKNGERILMYTESFGPEVGNYDILSGDWEFWDGICEPTHWMPLPGRPKEIGIQALPLLRTES